MSNVKINLNLANSLEFANNGNGPLKVKKSERSGNNLEFITSGTDEEIGLYAAAVPGHDGSSGTGYPDNYKSYDGILSGVTTPYSMDPYPGRIVGDCYIHRIFTSSNIDGTDIQVGGVLRDCDRVYPGDLYRFKNGNIWEYRIILSVNDSDTAMLTHSGVIAEVPVDNTIVN